MTLVLESSFHRLKFKFEAGTSRGVLREKDCWILRVSDTSQSGVYGYGECAPLPGLSEDPIARIDDQIALLKRKIASQDRSPKTPGEIYEISKELVPDTYPALRFAIEMALLDLMHDGEKRLFNNDFYRGKSTIPINGLIWMGDKDFMLEQVNEKISQGYGCLKMKIGALNFEQECQVLSYIRTKVKKEKLVLRVDANGAFQTNEAMKKLEMLARFDIHSIEQPIMRYQHEAMFLLCQKSQVPIALDEELIGIKDISEKARILDYIQPQYIILKPTLLGGFKATQEWIELAENMNIGWWITSALESNIGLNAIAQFTAQYHPQEHQGLGTGQLYENNFHSPLHVASGKISYKSEIQWDLSALKFK